MSKRIGGILMRAMLTAMLCSIFAVCASAQQLTSLDALAQGKGTLIANGVDEYKLTAVHVLLKENGNALITLYSVTQSSAQGRWSKTKDPKVINLKINDGDEGDDSRIKGKLILGEDGKSITSLTAKGLGTSGSKYEVNFVADEKDPAKP